MSDITAAPVTSLALSKLDWLRRFAGPTALAVGSIITVAGMAFHIEGDGSPADEALVRTIEGQLTQWLSSHFMLAVGMALVAGGATTVFRLARGRGAALTVVGASALVLGAALMSLGDFAHGSLSYALAGHVDAAASLAIQNAYFLQPAFAVISFGGMLLPVGVLILGVALLRSRAVPRWAAIVLLLSPVVMTFGFASGPRMLLLGLPFVVGMTVLARAIARS